MLGVGVLERAVHGVGLAAERVLLDLEPQRLRVEPGAGERVGEDQAELGVGELAVADVDADDQPGALRELAPLGELRAGGLEDPAAERHDQAGLLGDRDELRRLDEAAVAVGPARERLEAGDPAGRGLHDRLVDDLAARARSIAWRRSVSMSSRRITCSCMRASNTAWRPLPSALARYIATSASRSTVSGAASASASAMPIDASMNSSRSSISNGVRSVAWTRSATTDASCTSVTSSSSTVNSSPPRRATVSPGPDRRLEPPRDRDQQLVADLVAERVVDELEAVEVEEQHGRGRGRVRGAGRGGSPGRGGRGTARGSAGRSARRAARRAAGAARPACGP